MTDCINPKTSGVLFDGTNTAQVQKGQDLNVFIANVAVAVTTLTEAIAAVGVNPTQISTTGITSTAISPTGLTLAEWLTNVATYIKATKDALDALEADDVAYSGDWSAISASDPTNVKEGLDILEDYIENYLTDVINPYIYARIQFPVYAFYTGVLTITDTSSGGVPKITISAISYWANLKYITKIEEQITLTDDKDNYVYIDFVTSDYEVETVVIGGAVPDVEGQIVCKVQVSGGVLGDALLFVETNPILGDLIKDENIEGNHIKMATTFSAAFTKDAITNIISPVVKNSIELNSSVPQLVNDTATPGNTKYYGTNGAGTKGWFGFPYYASDTDDFIQFSDGSKGFKEVNDTYAQAKYEGNGAFTFGIRSEVVGDNSFVIGTADATKGEFSTGSNNTVQSSHIELETETVDATPTYMTIDGEFIEFREDTLSRVSIEVCAVDFTTSVAAIFDTLTFGVLNDGGTLTIPKNTPTAQSENSTYSDLTTIQYEVEIVSDVLYLKVTGKAGSTIRWGAKISKVEVNNKTNLS